MDYSKQIGGNMKKMNRKDIVELNNFHTNMERLEDKLHLLKQPQPISKPYCPGYEILIEDFEITWRGTKYTIPEGFIWDGASIPRFAWRVIGHGFMQELRAATILHDLFYDTGIIPREKADLAMKEKLIEYGVSKVRAGMMYAAVRVGGSGPWKTHRERERLHFTNKRLLAMIHQE